MPAVTLCPCSAPPVDPKRRKVIAIAAAAGFAGPLGVARAVAAENVGPVVGDRFVDEDAEGTFVPIKLSDLKPYKPLLVWPLDPASGKPRDGSRLAKVMLMRMNEADLDPDTKARSAGGVVAYSSMCTHQGCDVKTWLSKEKVLACFCHASKFEAHAGAAVTAGPAPRPLPALPIKLDGDVLVVAGPFTATPGGAV
jgi:rieske iron-sulfur protein